MAWLQNRAQTAIAAIAATLIVAAVPVGEARAQNAPPPTPTPMPIPPPIIERPPQTDELSRRWQFDARRMMEEQANLANRYRQTVEFAECAQRITPTRLATLLNQPLGTSQERRAADVLIRFAPGCLGNTMLVSTRLLRGAAAEAVLESYRSSDPDTAKEISSTRMENFLEATPGTGNEKDKTAVALTKMTQCQVLFAPGLARKLMDTKPDSDDEAALRGQLVEGTPMCGQVDAKNDFAWLIHRSYLAEALYHWTRSAGGFSRS
jgi:hypothetical protein